MNDTAYICLGKPELITDDIGNQIKKYDWSKGLVCEVKSIGQTEFYRAAQTDYKPEIQFVISDYLDYDGEDKVMFNDLIYNIVRTYRSGEKLEIVAERCGNEL